MSRGEAKIERTSAIIPLHEGRRLAIMAVAEAYRRLRSPATSGELFLTNTDLTRLLSSPTSHFLDCNCYMLMPAFSKHHSISRLILTSHDGLPRERHSIIFEKDGAGYFGDPHSGVFYLASK